MAPIRALVGQRAALTPRQPSHAVGTSVGALVADAVALHEVLGGDEQAVLIGSDWGAETGYGAAAVAPGRWRRLVTPGVPPFALDPVLFGDYRQLRRFFYLFFFHGGRPRRPLARPRAPWPVPHGERDQITTTPRPGMCLNRASRWPARSRNWPA